MPQMIAANEDGTLSFGLNTHVIVVPIRLYSLGMIQTLQLEIKCLQLFYCPLIIASERSEQGFYFLGDCLMFSLH
jgi:hypothetical protein